MRCVRARFFKQSRCARSHKSRLTSEGAPGKGFRYKGTVGGGAASFPTKRRFIPAFCPRNHRACTCQNLSESSFLIRPRFTTVPPRFRAVDDGIAQKEEEKDIEVVKEALNISNRRANELLDILSDEDMEILRSRVFKGGVK